MTRVPTPIIQPLDPSTVVRPPGTEGRDMPDLAGCCLPHGLDPRRSDEPALIELYATVDVGGERFDAFVDTLCHEIHHAVLFDVVSDEACDALDTIAGQGTYLRNGDYDLEPKPLSAWADYDRADHEHE